MDFVSFLKNLTLDSKIVSVFFLIGIFKNFEEKFTLFLLFIFGLKLFNSQWFSRGLIRFLRSGFCSKYVLGAKYGSDFDFGSDLDLDVTLIGKIGEKKDEKRDDSVCDDEIDISVLRNLIKMERKRAYEALVELEKERTASATAAEEALGMIHRLQNEKSLIEMELSQYKRLAEEKQIHDQEVIQYLQWLVWRHESERNVFEDELESCDPKSKRFQNSDEHEEDESSFRGNIMDALENVLYSSRDANLLLE